MPNTKIVALVVLLSIYTAATAPVGPAQQDTSGVGSGNAVVAPITAPIEVAGHAASALVGNTHGDDADTTSASAGGGTGTSGNQVVAPITAPIEVAGHAAGALVGNTRGDDADTTSASAGGGTGASGSEGNLSGNQAYAPVNVPVDVAGNAVSGLGGNAEDNSGAADAGTQ